MDVQFVEQSFVLWRSIYANILHLRPPQRNIVAVVWLLCAAHQNWSRNDTSTTKKPKSSLAFAFRFTQRYSMEADYHTEDGNRGTEKRSSYDVRCGSF